MAFDIYKRGQGKHTRLCTAFGIALVVGLGCLQLFRTLQATDLTMWVQTMVPAGLFVASSFLIFWVINKPSVADFMISSEGEVKKVSWSSKKEIVASTFIVICVVVLLGAFLGITDLIFRMFFTWLL